MLERKYKEYYQVSMRIYYLKTIGTIRKMICQSLKPTIDNHKKLRFLICVTHNKKHIESGKY